MLKELGISVRLIPGFGDYTTQMHGWNIVQLGDYYYNIDATWDSALLKENGTYSYFLKGDNFIDHLRMEEYRTAQFYFQYPMAAEDYDSKTLQRRSANSEKAIFMLIKPEFKKVLSRKIKIKKISGAKGYQIAYSDDKRVKKNVTFKKTKKSTYKFSQLKKKKKYYVRFRAYRTINGEKIYTEWSKIRKMRAR